MTKTLYTATGCIRCRLVRQLLEERGLTYRDYDALAEGKDAFRSFYQANRQRIYRGPDGIEFPIFYDNDVIRQGLPEVAAYLMAGSSLSGFFTTGQRHGQWIDGVDVSGGDPANGKEFLEVLAYLKNQGFKIQVDTNGVNADLLATVIEHNLADYILMEVKGALDLYSLLLPQPVEPTEIEKTIRTVSTFSQYHFFTNIAPIVRQPGDPPEISYMTPEEVAQAAKLIQTATGNNRQPYRLQFIDPENAKDLQLRSCEALAQGERFKYRTQARKHQFKTEIWQDQDHC